MRRIKRCACQDLVSFSGDNAFVEVCVEVIVMGIAWNRIPLLAVVLGIGLTAGLTYAKSGIGYVPLPQTAQGSQASAATQPLLLDIERMQQQLSALQTNYQSRIQQLASEGLIQLQSSGQN
ncbi:hypothetical protein [Ferroacidibacillus organovorans]|uniref:Uncharacterized protein n=1 Tax=Ferroacidibacillus organovorans TaxID=1765683 RepID=A0A162T193_9BACL|nr:hypothetical protein [Ferroacidibacillus organovorans]KYP80354.1 hypothetical protein AYJ22_11565 [Ferroacidibacillus organovorans]OAG93338.1 hypothetical protein AYW79_11095 [Ferroacidibacillus organovorans]OPG16501.1 hypothetical protein B2M26_06400 [Ferroacidibacillus organovorans]